VPQIVAVPDVPSDTLSQQLACLREIDQLKA
jgi:hypothetical protein